VQPETRYARLGEDRIAFQIIGEGSTDLVLGPGTFGSMDAEWELPEWALFYRRMAAFCRVIRFDPRGSGSSDQVPIDVLPPWESSVDEILAVMDAAGSERATILGFLNGGPPAMLCAATRPERTSGLILNHTAARHVRTKDYPWGSVRRPRQEWSTRSSTRGVPRRPWRVSSQAEPTTCGFAGGSRGRLGRRLLHEQPARTSRRCFEVTPGAS
jgi:pimeloyl-ACP methyl ester carboxylesterase